MFLRFLAISVFVYLVNGSFISSSRIENCVLDGSSSVEEASLMCEQKMVVTLVVSNGQVRDQRLMIFSRFYSVEKEQTETVEAIVEEAIDSQGQTRRLESPMRIRLRKSESLVIYPINYVQVCRIKNETDKLMGKSESQQQTERRNCSFKSIYL